MANHITAINQIGFVTDDIEKAIRNFEAIGLGGWSGISEVKPEDYEGMIVNDKKQKYGQLVATNNELDNIEIELIQPTDDKSDYADFLTRHGAGDSCCSTNPPPPIHAGKHREPHIRHIYCKLDALS